MSKVIIFFVSFTLYPVYSRGGKGNLRDLVLEHFIPHYPPRHCVSSVKILNISNENGTQNYHNIITALNFA